MSGSESSNRDGALAAEPGLLSFAVHSLPSPEAAGQGAVRTARGRRQMLLVLLACAAPVLASYLAYFVVRPQARSNYAELVLPPRPLPPALALSDPRRPGAPAVDAASLRGQWLLVVVAGGACDTACERLLVLQRQLHQALGAGRDRVDKVWLVDDAATPRAETLRAIRGEAAEPAGADRATVLRADPAALARWLEPSPGVALGARLYVVDPRGDFMLRAPVDPDPSRLKRDLDRLLRASASWDTAGRPR